ncbi:BTAD domain-containing putative transcriptional regulator [Couchioplanes azureus]|uniref:BTAD domain-containing putative transcriptional regulator n=1 Tax=Couchioplanes caeruleus TaxID=56438 RepID=UPI001670F992|nr:BTAD domain-containing putative transcriptional regulator [Couchioplanes caeruleus]GGQ82451.1 hypothetical protein GCM10010166_60760 [Couchioplanes caeruleus subsp. azureus]
MDAAAHLLAAGQGLVRPRLLDELDGLRTGRLAMIVAPAGAGKTTLLAQYAARWAGRVGAVQIETASTRARDVVRAIWQAIPALPAADRGEEVDELLAALRAVRTTDTLVLIDDIHLLAGAEAWAALETIVAYVPPWLHILCCGRRMPDLNLCRFELADACLVDGEHLRFRSWEVEQLLREVYREPMPPDDAAALTRRVSGWAAGLHMFHLSTRGRPLVERQRTVAALDGRSALTRSYLARTVLGELPPELRDFLVRTCVFDVLTPARCEGLLGDPGVSRRHLEELERRQAFTASPDGGHTFRYHEVLRAHLAITLAEEIGEAAARQWHARAAALLAAEGADLEAARAYARAADWPAVRRLLTRLGIRVADEGVEPWLDLLPDWLVAEDPWLMLAEGRYLMACGRLTAAVRHLRSAEERFSDEGARARCRAARRLASTWLPGRAVLAGHYSAALREATRQHPTLVAAEAQGEPLVQAVAYLLAGNVAEAHQALVAGTADDSDVGHLGVRLLQACWAIAAGSAADGRRQLAEVLVEAERAELPWLVRMGRAALALDGSARGAAEAAAVVGECDRAGDQWGGVLARAVLCLVRSLSPEAGPADVEATAELLRRCRALDAGVLEAWAQALATLAAARTGMSGTDVAAERPEALARSAGVPGARVAALAAATRCGTAGTDPRSLALQCGLPVRVAGRWAGVESPAAGVREPAPVEVRCFGGFQLRLHDRPLDLSMVKPRARTMLRLLAMHAGRPVHREALIEALWSALPPGAATRNLHVTMSSLRTFLSPGGPRGCAGLVARNGDAYHLSLPEGGYSDVTDFRGALKQSRQARLAGDAASAAAALQRALLAYGGDLLPEEGPAEWVVWERDMLRREAAEAAAALAADALAAGRYEEAVVAAERCVQIDRYSDEGWRSLVDGYDRLGHRAAAARARDSYAEIVASL